MFNSDATDEKDVEKKPKTRTINTKKTDKGPARVDGGGVSKPDDGKNSMSFSIPKVVKKLSTDKIKEFIVTMGKVPTPFLLDVKRLAGGGISAVPACVCGERMIRKNKMYICSGRKCPFQISIEAFDNLIKYDYLNDELATTEGLIVPRCEVCHGMKLVTGGEMIGQHVCCWRCFCAKSNLKLIMARGTTNDVSVTKICSTGIFNYKNLPLQEGENGPIKQATAFNMLEDF
jgi:hypothetical protein